MKEQSGVKYYKTPTGRLAWEYVGAGGTKLARSAQTYADKVGAKRGFMSFVQNVKRTGHPGALRERGN